MVLTIRYLRGVVSTVLLYLVDVEKSRVECEAFIVAEAKREAFAGSHFDDVAVQVPSLTT